VSCLALAGRELVLESEILQIASPFKEGCNPMEEERV
jgi:hypothetical protein